MVKTYKQDKNGKYVAMWGLPEWYNEDGTFTAEYLINHPIVP